MKALASSVYASGLMHSDTNATPVERCSSIALDSTGSAHGVSPGSRGGNASNATSPTLGSLASADNASTNMSVSTAAWPVTSSGLFCDAYDGKARFSAVFVARVYSGKGRSAAPAASANSVHAPPDCSAAATPSVRSFFVCDSSTAASNIETGSSTSTTPCPRSHASRRPVLPASAPVCAMIERNAASDFPSGAQISTGFRAASNASSPAPIPSTSRIVSM